MMARTQTLVQLNESLLALLDQRAAARGVSRSQIIREAIEEHLADDLDAEVTRRVLEGYDRWPQAGADVWGEPAAFGGATARMAYARVEAEESAAGHEPW